MNNLHEIIKALKESKEIRKFSCSVERQAKMINQYITKNPNITLLELSEKIQYVYIYTMDRFVQMDICKKVADKILESSEIVKIK